MRRQQAYYTLAIAVFIVTGAAAGQSLYKYQDENGEWIYTDRSPPAEQTVEVRTLPTGSKPPTVSITTRITDHELNLLHATNISHTSRWLCLPFIRLD
jgi:hypothetical protein